MYKPKSKRTSKQLGPVKKKTLDGLTANKNIDDIIALSKLSNAQGLEIKSIESDLSGIHSDITTINNTKQNKLTLTTDGFYGPSTLVNDVLNVPDYSSAPAGLYAETGDSIPVTNTTTEGTLINGGEGTLSVPANAFSVGDSFEVFAGGRISSVNNETLRIKIKSGTIILADSGLITLPQTTNKNWFLIVTFTVRRTGAASVAQLVTFSQLTYNKDSSNAFEGAIFSTVNNTTFDTTIANTLDITAQWGSANTGNSIYTEVLTLTQTY